MLGCTEGRSAATWVDFNLGGHQLVAHLVRGYEASRSANAVDGGEFSCFLELSVEAENSQPTNQ